MTCSMYVARKPCSIKSVYLEELRAAGGGNGRGPANARGADLWRQFQDGDGLAIVVNLIVAERAALALGPRQQIIQRRFGRDSEPG